MKCDYCGYNLNLEDLFCPHCGKKNEHIARHVADMEHYEKEFEATRDEVISNSKKFNTITARIVVACILIVLIVAGFIAINNSYEIRSRMIERRLQKNKAKYCEVIEKYEADRDYISLYYYMINNKLTYADAFSEYGRVASCVMKYTFIYEEVMGILNGSNMTYTTKEQSCENIASYIIRMASDAERGTYDKDMLFEDGREELMNDCMEDTRDFVQVYFGLSDEDAAEMFQMNKSRLSLLLIDSLDNLESINRRKGSEEDVE